MKCEWDVVQWALGTARSMLREQPTRILHVEAVARKSRDLVLHGRLADCLESAAYLHDVGYSNTLIGTGCHQIDGARWVARRGLPGVAALVATHSEAAVELGLRGRGQLLSEFDRPDPVLADALTYCDMTTGPEGDDVTLEERIDEVGDRRGRDSLVYQALVLARPRYEDAIARTLQVAGRHQENAALGSRRK